MEDSINYSELNIPVNFNHAVHGGSTAMRNLHLAPTFMSASCPACPPSQSRPRSTHAVFACHLAQSTADDGYYKSYAARSCYERH